MFMDIDYELLATPPSTHPHTHTHTQRHCILKVIHMHALHNYACMGSHQIEWACPPLLIVPNSNN